MDQIGSYLLNGMSGAVPEYILLGLLPSAAGVAGVAEFDDAALAIVEMADEIVES